MSAEEKIKLLEQKRKYAKLMRKMIERNKRTKLNDVTKSEKIWLPFVLIQSSIGNQSLFLRHNA